eukprot:m.164694 g.164694  ORF g.164694 m.164694 type:complete len:301 (-) comp12458_c0_seq1:2055-2957(-)
MWAATQKRTASRWKTGTTQLGIATDAPSPIMGGVCIHSRQGGVRSRRVVDTRHQRHLGEGHLSMVAVRAVGNGDNQKRDTTRQRHGLKARGVTPQAWGLENVPRLIKLGEVNLTRATVNGFLTAHQFSRNVVVNGHFKTRWRVAVEMDGRQVLVLAAGGQHSPDLPCALIDGCSRWRLRHIVLGQSASCSNTPSLSWNGSNVEVRVVVLEVNAILLIVCEWLILPPQHSRIVFLVRVEKRPHVLAHLQSSNVRPHIACRVLLRQHTLPGLGHAVVDKPKFLAGWKVLDGTSGRTKWRCRV